MTAYLDYVVANYEGYLSLVKGAAGGNETLRQIYDEARFVLTDRIFLEDAQGELITDTPTNRLIVRGWAAMTEELVITWAAAHHAGEDPEVSRDELLTIIAGLAARRWSPSSATHRC